MDYFENDNCECGELHIERVDALRKDMPSFRQLTDLAELFKLFSDSTRIRILCALFGSELCVCDLAELLNMGQSAISHQLRILRSGKLVTTRREGKSVFYMLDDDHVRLICDQGFAHINENKPRDEGED